MLAVAAIMTTLSASAQFEPEEWSLDLNVGLGASWMNNADKRVFDETTVNKQLMPSALINVGASYQVSKKLGLSASLSYCIQGQAWKKFTIDGVEYSNNTLELTYLQVPVMAHYYIYKGLAINAGVQVGFMMNADDTHHGESTTSKGRKQTDDIRVDYKKDLKTVDLTIPLGISYETSDHFVWALQYNLGLTDVDKKTVPFGKGLKNQAIYLTFGYKIGL